MTEESTIYTQDNREGIIIIKIITLSNYFSKQYTTLETEFNTGLCRFNQDQSEEARSSTS